MVTDAKYKILNVVAMWPGCCPDTWVFHESLLCTFLEISKFAEYTVYLYCLSPSPKASSPLIIHSLSPAICSSYCSLLAKKGFFSRCPGHI